MLAGGSLGSAHSLFGSITLATALSPLSSGGSAQHWRLDTKYYTADVLFELRHVDQSLRLGNSVDELAAYEAVLLAFEADRPESFASLQRWWDAAGGGSADLGVRLAIGLGPGGGGESGSSAGSTNWMAEAEEWCAEQLVELVHVSQNPAEGEGAPGSTAAVLENASSSYGRDEATGVDRIREALQAHMWPGMQLKPSPQRGGAAPGPPIQQAKSCADVEDAVPPAEGSGRLANGTSSTDSSGGPQAAGTPAGTEAAAEDGLSFADYLRSPAEAAAAAARGRRGAGGAPKLAAGAAAVADASGEAEVEELQRLFAMVAG